MSISRNFLKAAAVTAAANKFSGTSPIVARMEEAHELMGADNIFADIHGLLLKVFYTPLVGITYALEAKDAYSYDHSERVAELAERFIKFLEISPRNRQLAVLTAQVHDIGKIGIPDAILLKPGPLTDEEYTVMKEHAVIGANIIHKASQPDLKVQRGRDGKPITPEVPEPFRLLVVKMEEGIRHHHERWDGKGYPDGLSGTAIPEIARILALCDSTDAMLSTRIYRKALTNEKCREQIERNSGLMYDPEMTAVYLRHWNDIVTPTYAERQKL